MLLEGLVNSNLQPRSVANTPAKSVLGQVDNPESATKPSGQISRQTRNTLLHHASL